MPLGACFIGAHTSGAVFDVMFEASGALEADPGTWGSNAFVEQGINDRGSDVNGRETPKQIGSVIGELLLSTSVGQ
jgi:hypothetical protein